MEDLHPLAAALPHRFDRIAGSSLIQAIENERDFFFPASCIKQILPDCFHPSDLPFAFTE
jgi:hypothetical protein